MAAAPSSGAAKLLSSPWNAPIGVRARPTMTTGSFSMEPPSGRKIVRAHQAAAPFDDLRGEWARLAGLRVDVHAGQYADRRDFVGHRIAHLVHEPGELFAHFEEGGTHDHRVAGM